jgi:hypothetical protein
MKAIREAVPMPTETTLLEKTIPKAEIQKYVDGKYTKVLGFVNRAQDTQGVRDFSDLYNSMRLDYPPKSMSELPRFNLSDDSAGLIRFKTADSQNIEVPYSNGMGGSVKAEYPFTGNGFTASVNGHVVPEFKIGSQNGVLMENGAELYEISKGGFEKLVAIYSEPDKKFIPIKMR